MVAAYAKATLTLRVLRRRPDGFHDLEALTVALSEPHDDVDVELTQSGGVVLDMTADPGPVHVEIPADGTNLASRAAVAAGARNLRIRLHKRIPAQAGLGGGSADAAAVLRALDTPSEVGAELAGQLGSDVSFCLRGGLAWMRGRGEIVDAVEPAPADFAVIVAAPPFGLSTPAVYRAWDELGAPAARRRIEPPRQLRPLTDSLFNDLESAAEAVEPRLAPWREAMEAALDRATVMAGSGSAYLAVLDEPPSSLELTLAGPLAGTRVWVAKPI